MIKKCRLSEFVNQKERKYLELVRLLREFTEIIDRPID